MPILMQQAIDRGIVERRRRARSSCVATLAAIAAASPIVIAGFAQRAAVVRLGTRSESGALRTPGPPDRAHPPGVSLADHNEERRGVAGGPGHQRHRDARPVLPVGRAGLAAQRPAHADRGVGDVGLRLDPGAGRLRRSRRRWSSCCGRSRAVWSPAYETARAPQRRHARRASPRSSPGRRPSGRIGAGPSVDADAATAVDQAGRRADPGRRSSARCLFPSGEVFAVLTVAGVRRGRRAAAGPTAG